MTTSFPTALDALTNPAPTDAMDSATVPHAEQHANANDAIEALQAKVGIDASANPASLDYRVAAVETGKSDTSHNHDAAYVNVGGDSMTGPLNITASTTPQVLTATGSYKDATQVIPNSEFADASSWTLSGGWQISGGELTNPTGVAGNISVPLTGLTPNVPYVIEFGILAQSVYFLPSLDGGATTQSYFRSWENPKEIGFIPNAANVTLTLTQNYVTATARVDYIRAYKVNRFANRVFNASTMTAPGFDFSASLSSFGIGSETLQYSSNAQNSIAIGDKALSKAVRPYECIAIGANALKNHASPSSNLAIGNNVMQYATSGGDNCIVGPGGTGAALTSGGSNAVFGQYSAAQFTSATYNTSIGNQVTSNMQTGDNNTCVGFACGNTLSGGSQNTLIGARIMWSGTMGAYGSMTLLGYGAGGATLYPQSICLGHGSVVSGSYQVQLGPSGYTTYAYGAVQDRSDRRDKSDIRPTILGLDFIKALTPVDFKWDMRDDYRVEVPDALSERLQFLRREKRMIADVDGDVTAIEAEITTIEAQVATITQGNLLDNITQDGRKKRNRYHHGLIAQDVRKVMNDMGVDFGGFQNHKLNGGQDVLSIGYTELIGPLIKAIQEQQAMIEALQAQVDALTP